MLHVNGVQLIPLQSKLVSMQQHPWEAGHGGCHVDGDMQVLPQPESCMEARLCTLVQVINSVCCVQLHQGKAGHGGR